MKYSKEYLHMQKLAGVITEHEYKTKLMEINIPTITTILNRPSSRPHITPSKINKPHTPTNPTNQNTKTDTHTPNIPIPSPGQYLVTYQDENRYMKYEIINAETPREARRLFWKNHPNTMGKYIIDDITN